MERIWHKAYGNATPKEIDLSGHTSVVAMLEEAMRKYADRTAFVSATNTLSYADIDRLSARFAAYLQARLGVKKGDRIAMMSPNLLAFPVAMFGILRAGAVQVNVNPLYTPRELEHQLNDAGGGDDRDLQRRRRRRWPGSSAGQGQERDCRWRLGDLGHRLAQSAGGARHRNSSACPMRWRRVPAPLHAGGPGAGRPVVLAVHRRYHRGVEGRDAVARESGGEHPAVPGLHPRHPARGAGGGRHGAAAVPHLRADGELRRTSRWAPTNYLVANPRDMDGFIAGAQGQPLLGVSGVNTLFAGMMPHPEFKNVDFSN